MQMTLKTPFTASFIRILKADFSGVNIALGVSNFENLVVSAGFTF